MRGEPPHITSYSLYEPKNCHYYTTIRPYYNNGQKSENMENDQNVKNTKMMKMEKVKK